MKASSSHKLVLLLILVVAAGLRLWQFPSYFPLFWDEAKYLNEIEGAIDFFSVNAGAFAFLKLGYNIIGYPTYPQIITTIFGLLTILGLYILGKRIIRKKPAGIHLGLLMAGQAALMPYFVRYSRHALPTVFALCFFVFALNFYLARLQYLKIRNTTEKKNYLTNTLLAILFLAMVPACSFKFLVPTLILFIILEIFIWRTRSRERRSQTGYINLVIHLFSGLILFLLMPVMLSIISGYDGWFQRAMQLSEFHSTIETMRLAFHFLYPVHLYHLTGIFFIICFLAGVVVLMRQKGQRNVLVDSETNIILGSSFLVYLLFFGFLSHLQSARLYALTLPFLVYASSIFLLPIHGIQSRQGKFMFVGCVLLLSIFLGYRSLDYITKSSNLPETCDVAMQHLQYEGLIYANAKSQVAYCTHNSSYHRGFPYHVVSFMHTERRVFKKENPPLVIIHDAADLVATIASHDKFDRLDNIETIKKTLGSYRSITGMSDRIYAAPDRFYLTPHYYLEDLYSWRSYRYIRTLLPQMRDSIYIYKPKPALEDTTLQQP